MKQYLDFCNLLDLFGLAGDNESGSEFEYGDGIPDMIVPEQHLDSDGDGRADTIRTDLTMDLDHDGLHCFPS